MNHCLKTDPACYFRRVSATGKPIAAFRGSVPAVGQRTAFWPLSESSGARTFRITPATALSYGYSPNSSGLQDSFESRRLYRLPGRLCLLIDRNGRIVRRDVSCLCCSFRNIPHRIALTETAFNRSPVRSFLCADNLKPRLPMSVAVFLAFQPDRLSIRNMSFMSRQLSLSFHPHPYRCAESVFIPLQARFRHRSRLPGSCLAAVSVHRTVSRSH